MSSRYCLLRPGRLLDPSLVWHRERNMLFIVTSAVFATQSKTPDIISGYSICPWMPWCEKALDKNSGSASAVIHFFTSSNILDALCIRESDRPSHCVCVWCIWPSSILEQCKIKLGKSTKIVRSRDRKPKIRDCKFSKGQTGLCNMRACQSGELRKQCSLDFKD